MSFGKKIRNLREQQGLLQRELASCLKIDTPMLSKIERGERKAKREYLATLAEELKIQEKELLLIWLADQVNDILKDEPLATEVLNVAEEEIRYRTDKS
jgi:transcriptional regulator with XRE-family HTH domain